MPFYTTKLHHSHIFFQKLFFWKFICHGKKSFYIAKLLSFFDTWRQGKYVVTFSHLYFLSCWYFLLNFKIKVLPVLRNLRQPNSHIYFFVLVSCTGPVIEKKYIMQCCAFFSVKWARLSLLRSAHEGRVHSRLDFQF